MYYYVGLSHKEFAGIRCVTEKSVSSLIAKARAMIRERIEKNGNGNGSKNANAALGMGVSAPVLSRVLRQQATEQLSEQALAMFNAKTAAATSGVKLATAKAALSVKIISVAAVVAVIGGGAYLAATNYHVPEVASQTVVSESGTDSGQLAVRVTNIKFLGGDCDCGHENPDSAQIDGDEATLTDARVTWDIKSLKSEKIIFSGEGSEVSAEFETLRNDDKDGQYTLTYYIEDKNHNIVTMEREFEIGDFA
jgi:hypothetical protein